MKYEFRTNPFPRADLQHMHHEQEISKSGPLIVTVGGIVPVYGVHWHNPTYDLELAKHDTRYRKLFNKVFPDEAGGPHQSFGHFTGLSSCPKVD